MPDRAAVSRKAIVIIAGPNGAGKTTFALAYLRIEASTTPTGRRPSLKQGAIKQGAILTCVDPDSTDAQATSIHGEQWHRGVLDALTRAAKQARLIAYQKGTGVVTRRDGKLVVVAPDPAMYKDLIPPPFVESPQS